MWTTDIKQAFLQSDRSLTRSVYLRPPLDFHLNPGKLMRILKQLYGLSDAGDYWYATLRKLLQTELDMIPTLLDPAIFFQRHKTFIGGATGTYFDDTIHSVPKSFMKKTTRTAQIFNSKPVKSDKFTFSGVELDSIGNIVHIRKSMSEGLLTLVPHYFTFR